MNAIQGKYVLILFFGGTPRRCLEDVCSFALVKQMKVHFFSTSSIINIVEFSLINFQEQKKLHLLYTKHKTLKEAIK